MVANLCRGELWSVLTLLLVLGAVDSATAQSSQPQALCYAFLRDGDVLLTCDGRTEQITHFDDVEGFVVAPEQGVLVLIRHRATQQGGALLRVAKGEPVYVPSYSALQTIELTTGKRSLLSPLQTPTELAISCGTVLSLTWDPRIGNRLGLAHDALTGERVRFDPYRNFRCSADRRVVAGWMDWDHKVLRAGVPPRQVLYDAGSEYRLRYDVSPNGNYIVYNAIEQAHGRLCLISDGEEPECIEEGFSEGRISISDSKSVLFETTTGRACHYKDPYHFSIGPRPGYTEGDLCPVIAYWRAGEKESNVVEPLGRSPQWVTPQTACALRAWGEHARARQKASP